MNLRYDIDPEEKARMVFTKMKAWIKNEKLMKYVKDQNLSQIIPFLLYLVFYMIWFTILERLPRTRFFDLSSEIDTYIPLIVAFFILYQSCLPVQ